MKHKIIWLVVMIGLLAAFCYFVKPDPGFEGVGQAAAPTDFDKRPEGCELLPYSGVENRDPGDTTQDVRGGMVCALTISPNVPQFIFNFVGTEDNTIHKVAVSSVGDPKLVQTLDIDIDTRALYPQEFEGIQLVDANADGYYDLSIKNQCGATGNCTYAFYLYDPKTDRFVPNEFLSGDFNPEFSPNGDVTFSGNSSARDNSSMTYRYENGEYMLIRKRESIWNRDDDTLTENTYELQEGEMKLISSTTTPNY